MAENEKAEDGRRNAFIWRDRDNAIWINCGVKTKGGIPFIDRLNGAERLPFDKADKEYGPLIPLRNGKGQGKSDDSR